MEHVLALSYGKDSIACLGAIKQLNLPLDRIVHAEIWATDTIPADLPPMVEFKKKADKIIKEKTGIKVEHYHCTNLDGEVRDKITYETGFYHILTKGKNKGSIKGFPLQKGNWCQKLKVNTVSKMTNKDDIRYLGIACDEESRFKDLNDKNISPLVLANWSEADAKQWCIENDLLSPIYNTEIRGGCWFCHNQGIEALRRLRHSYPEYWDMLLKWDNDSPVPFRADGHTVHDFELRFEMEDNGLIPKDKSFRWKMLEQPQMIMEEFK